MCETARNKISVKDLGRYSVTGVDKRGVHSLGQTAV